MGDSLEDDDWTPPTAADMKIIEARQERSNQISKLMGNYMLKGYRMLNKVCQCGTILLQDRGSVEYCVACNELESECAKDDPALSSEAARVAALEGQQSVSTSVVKQNNEERMSIYNSAEQGSSTEPPKQAAMPQSQGDTISSQTPPEQIKLLSRMTPAISELQKLIFSSSQELNTCSSIELKIQLCNLIKSASEAVLALNKLD